MLVVVKDRYIQALLQFLFDVKTFRSFDILQVDAAEGRRQVLYRLDDLFRIFRIQFDIEYIDIGEPLEEYPFAFHHRLTG